MELSPIKVVNMEQILNYIPMLIIAIVVLIGFRMGWKWFLFYKRVTHVKGFADYISVLEFHMNKAYDLIHKDRILVYSLEATKLPDEEFQAITQDFVRLVIKFIGPELKNDFVSFYGDENTFIFNMVEYFNTRYEEDSIRKQTLDDMSDQNLPGVSTYEQGTIDR